MILHKTSKAFLFIQQFCSKHLSGHKKIKSQSLIFFVFLFTVFSFQNCKLNETLDLSSVSIMSKKQSAIDIQPVENAQQTSSGGNGDGYEGKLDGRFVRWIPEHTCEGNEAGYAELVIDSSKNTAQLITNESALCHARSDENIDLKNIEFSNLNQNMVAYKDGIYVKEQSSVRNIEAWCQTDQLQINIYRTENIIPTPTKNDTDQLNASNSRIAEIYLRDSKTNRAQRISSIPIIQKISSATVHIESSIEYNLDLIHYEKNPILESIQLRILAHKPGLSDKHQFDSFLTSKSSFEDLTQTNLKLNCRLAGNYDGVIWPSKILVQGKQVHDYELLQKNNVDLGFVLSADNIQTLNKQIGPKKLFYLDLTDGSLKDLVSEFPSKSTGIQKFLITQDRENIVYSAIENPLGFTDIFRLSLDLKIKNKISSDRSFSGYGALSNFQEDPNSHRIVFMESSNQMGIPQTMFYLRTNTLDGSSMQNIISESGDLNEQTRSYWVDSILNKIFFYTGFTNVQLNIFDPVTNQLMKAVDTSTLQQSEQVMNWYDVLNASDVPYQHIHSQLLLSVVRSGITSPVKRLIKSNLDGSQPIDLGEFESVKAYSDDGTKLILEAKNGESFEYKYIDLQDLRTFTVPNGQTYFFNSAADGIYFWKTRTETHAESFLDLYFYQLTSKTAYIVKSIPTQQKIVNRFQWLNHQQYLVFMMDSNLDGLNELYLLDMFNSQKEIIQISDRYFDYGGVKDFKIINDRSVVYSTQPLNSISPSLFMWSLPLAE